MDPASDFGAAPVDEKADPFLATLEKARATGTMSEKQFAKAKANYQRSLEAAGGSAGTSD